MIYDILGKAVSQWVSNTTCIWHILLIMLPGSIVKSGLHSFLSFQFKDTFPPTETCLYGYINLVLAQTKQKSSLGLSQSWTFMRGGKGKPKSGFQSHVQKQTVLDCSSGPLVKKSHFETRIESHPDSRKSLGDTSGSFANSRKKGSCGYGTLDVLHCTTSSTASSYIMQVGRLSQLLDQWRSITSSRFVLNVFKGHHLQLKCHAWLFWNFKWFNIEVATAHHRITQ